MHLAHARQPSAGHGPPEQARRQPGVAAQNQPHFDCHWAAGAARSHPNVWVMRRPSCNTESYRAALAQAHREALHALIDDLAHDALDFIGCAHTRAAGATACEVYTFEQTSLADETIPRAGQV